MPICKIYKYRNKYIYTYYEIYIPYIFKKYIYTLLLATLLVRSPLGQVVPKQLHDQRIFLGVLCHTVKLRDGILERCASHLTCLIGIF